MGATMRAGIQQELNIFGFQLLALAQTRSPVDTGRFRAAWQLSPFYGANTIAGIMLTNNVPYAGVLEFGSRSGKKPWPSAGPKTVVHSGRIYSRQAPGGIMAPVLPSIAQNAAERVLQGIRR
jgi:hypothetical protein